MTTARRPVAGRNRLPTEGRWLFVSYLATVTVLGVVALAAVALWAPRHGFGSVDGATLVVVAFVVLGELRPLIMPGRGNLDGVPVAVAFLFALLITSGPLQVLALVFITAFLADLGRESKLWRSAFNGGQTCLSWTAAWGVLRAFGISGDVHRTVSMQGSTFGGIVLAAIAYFVVNNILVGIAVGVHDHLNVVRVIGRGLAGDAVTSFPLLASAPLVVAVMQASPWLVPLLLLPMAVVYVMVSISRESEHAALHDGLTGLPNRSLLALRLAEVMADGRVDGSGAALLLLDLDRFKDVNDTLGHFAGDELLRQVARRLNTVVRPGDTICRLGGDEFALLLPWAADESAAAAVGMRVAHALSEQFEVGGMLLDAAASVGVALYPQHAPDADTLIRCADVAMYQAKAARSGTQVYRAELDHNSADRLALLGDLRRALTERTLEVHYQPIADATTARIISVEALVRWNHPRRGMVAPDEFVPLAEQSGLMRALTEFVLDAATREVAIWRRSGLTVAVSVNISARDLVDRWFLPYVRRCLTDHRVPGSSLILEVTERVLADDDARAVAALDELKVLGVRVSLDDFGTGFSSLGRLETLQVGEIKIDRSFVSRLDDNDNAPIVRSLVELAHSLGLAVVAEGVETARAWRTLNDYGCDLIQGWYLARAMPPAEMAEWLAAHQGEPVLASLIPGSGELGDISGIASAAGIAGIASPA